METRAQILRAGSELIASSGYNGFTYGAVATRVGIRNASIHHHFPAKSDLALAVVRDSRLRLEEHALLFAKTGASPLEQIAGYLDYWKKCISDGTASFCVAGMLAAELPTLPRILADEVKAHFTTLIDWFARLFSEARTNGVFVFATDPRIEAEQFVATVYGAMLSARALSDAQLFSIIVDQALARLREHR